MNHKLLTFIGLIGIGAAVGATLHSLNQPDSTGENKQIIDKQASSGNLNNPFTSNKNNSDSDKLEQLDQTIRALQNQVQTEIKKRKQLEQKVAILEKDFSSSTHEKNTSNNDTHKTPINNAANPLHPGTSNRKVNWINEQALIDAGIDQAKVSNIKNTFEQAEMDKLYLRDQATREGWMGSERYNDALKEITDRTGALRSQLNDYEYDAYLYASGRSNRVFIESVLSNSPASNAGIQAGDVILTYDNQRIYNWSDLTGATSKGTANTTIAVTISRNGQQQQVYVPRGPLGVRLNTDSVAPQ